MLQSLYKQKWLHIKNRLPKKAELHGNRNTHSKCVSGLLFKLFFIGMIMEIILPKKPQGESRAQNCMFKWKWI